MPWHSDLSWHNGFCTRWPCPQCNGWLITDLSDSRFSPHGIAPSILGWVNKFGMDKLWNPPARVYPFSYSRKRLVTLLNLDFNWKNCWGVIQDSAEAKKFTSLNLFCATIASRKAAECEQPGIGSSFIISPVSFPWHAGMRDGAKQQGCNTNSTLGTRVLVLDLV